MNSKVLIKKSKRLICLSTDPKFFQHVTVNSHIFLFGLSEQSIMPKKRADGQPRGRMSSYAFFVQSCREEHKKKHPGDTIVFGEFTKKCAEQWKVRNSQNTRKSSVITLQRCWNLLILNKLVRIKNWKIIPVKYAVVFRNLCQSEWNYGSQNRLTCYFQHYCL